MALGVAAQQGEDLAVAQPQLLAVAVELGAGTVAAQQAEAEPAAAGWPARLWVAGSGEALTT